MSNFQVRFFHTGNQDPDQVRSIFDASVHHTSYHISYIRIKKTQNLLKSQIFLFFSKAVFVLHGEVLTGFKHSFKKQLPKVFNEKVCLAI